MVSTGTSQLPVVNTGEGGGREGGRGGEHTMEHRGPDWWWSVLTPELDFISPRLSLPPARLPGGPGLSSECEKSDRSGAAAKTTAATTAPPPPPPPPPPARQPGGQ